MARDIKIDQSEDQLARRAIASIRGYSYQLYTTAAAWTALAEDELLLVEVTEDFAIVAGQALEAVQVKDDASRAVTLRHPSVGKTLNGWWSTRKSNPQLSVKSTYLTTASVGREIGMTFPDNAKGLDYWRDAADGGDVRPIRHALLQLQLEPELLAWVRSAEDVPLREELLQRVTWRYGADNQEKRRFQLLRDVRRRPGMFLALDDATRVVDAMIIRLLKHASTEEPSPLTSEDLDAIFETASVTLSHDQLRRIASGEAEIFHPPLYLPERDGDGGRLFFFGAQDRVPLVGREHEQAALFSWLQSTSTFSWTLVTGPGGAGKSRLGLELCLQARALGWHVGFLPMASSYGAVEKFVHFRPSQPTLLIIDYAGDAPSEVGALVCTLCERGAADDLTQNVRLLLLDRAGIEAPWWQRFTADHERLIQSYRGDLGNPFLLLPPLDGASLLAIVDHLTSDGESAVKTRILEAVKQLDPQGRPLFAALAGDALRAGNDVRDLDRNGVLNDILDRERRHWRRSARSDDDLSKHLVACVVATMTGALQLPQDAQVLSSPLLPFSEESYNGPLVRSITGRQDAFSVAPLEPDILGEWLALDLLHRQSPFDSRPDEIRDLVARRVAASNDAALHYAAFRSRAVEDFPERVLSALLLAPPADDAPDHARASFLAAAASAFPIIVQPFPKEAGAIFSHVERFHAEAKNWPVEREANAAVSAYVDSVVEIDLAQALAIFDKLNLEAMAKPVGWAQCQNIAFVGQAIIAEQLARGEFEPAEKTFEDLRRLAKANVTAEEADEVGSAVASAGLYMRDWYYHNGHDAAGEKIDIMLWEPPQEPQSPDLASHAGHALMETTSDLYAYVAYEELKDRVKRRPAVSSNVFWAACCGVKGLIAAPEETTLEFIERIRNVAQWLEDHEDNIDVPHAIDWIIEDGMMANDFGLGPVPTTLLFNAWRRHMIGEAHIGDNQLHVLQSELEAALESNEHALWVDEIRGAMADLIARRRQRH